MSTTTEDGDEQVFFDAELFAINHEGSHGAMAEAKREAIGVGSNGFGAGLEDASDRTSARAASRSSPPSMKEQQRAATPFTARTRRKSLRLRYDTVQEGVEEPVPVPPIPLRFLRAKTCGREAPLLRVDIGEQSRPNAVPYTHIHHTEAPLPKDFQNARTTASATAAGEKTPIKHTNQFQTHHPTQFPEALDNYELTRPPVTHGSSTTFQTKSAPATPSKMAYYRAPQNFDKIDLFMELGHEEGATQSRNKTPALQRAVSRASQYNKRMSLPADIATRPSTSGSAYTRPSSRLDSLRASMDIPRSPYTRRFSAAQERPPSRILDRVMSPASQASTQFGRRRNTSFDTALSRQSDHDIEPRSSPPGSTDPPRTDSSVASHTPDTVWDELDELKTRIKNLETGGKAPPTSSAAASGESSDRPRTATTAPTTIDSSPKHTRKPEAEPQPLQQTTTPPSDIVVAGSSTSANVHPLLQNALGRAKPLLNSSVYRTLEAIANDSMQLAATTSGAVQQGSNPVSVTTHDRHVRRKADNICRGLTDLCIALCDTKQEQSPIVAGTDIVTSPTLRSTPLSSLRNTRSTSLAINTKPTARPQSRLEARRSSLLASLPRGELESISPRGSFGGDHSASEAEYTPSHSNTLPPRRLSAAPQGILRSRQTQEDTSADEGRSFRVRAPSRAMTDIGGLRAKSRLISEDRSPGAQRRTPSLRESLSAKRGKLLFENTPPVLEEETIGPEVQQRRPSRQAIATEIPSRKSSLHQRRRGGE